VPGGRHNLGMLNPDLDIESLAEVFRERRRVRITDALRPEAAESLHTCLRDEIPWRFACYDNRREGKETALKLTREQLSAMPLEQRQMLQHEVLRQAASQFQYAYQSFDLLEGLRTGVCSGIFAYELMGYLAGDAFFDFMTRLTCDDEINRIDGHATCYRAGHFLKFHADESPWEDRRFAYVLGVTRDWDADMGGLTCFMDESGRVVECHVPDFNTLTVFEVPVAHFVSVVSPWVTGQRLSVTGWLTVSGD
jgi:Rps23 Pro-64 3,4-dihydroxylase Tpa1-like proline 4-hydroxylase